MKPAPPRDLRPLDPNVSIVDQADRALKETLVDADTMAIERKFVSADAGEHGGDEPAVITGW